MSDNDGGNPTRSFKDFIGWAFIGLAGIVLALLTLIYSSLHADVVRLDATSQSHGERIRGAEDHFDSQKDLLRQIEVDIRKLSEKIDGMKSPK